MLCNRREINHVYVPYVSLPKSLAAAWMSPHSAKVEYRYNGFNTLRWRHNGCDSVSNHQPYDCLLNHLFRRRSKKTSKLRVASFYVGIHQGPVNSPHKWPVTRKMFLFDDVIMTWNKFVFSMPVCAQKWGSVRCMVCFVPSMARKNTLYIIHLSRLNGFISICKLHLTDTFPWCRLHIWLYCKTAYVQFVNIYK